MLFTQQSKLHPGTTYQVKDVSRLFWLIVSGIFWSVVAYYLFKVQDVNAVYSFLNGGVLIGNLTQSWLYVAALGGLILTILFAVRAVFRFVANFNGVVVDLNEGTVRYPGGGVIRNKFSDLFRARFLFQSCYRFVTPLDQIRMIEPRNVTVETKGSGAAAMALAKTCEQGSEQRRSLEDKLPNNKRHQHSALSICWILMAASAR